MSSSKKAQIRAVDIVVADVFEQIKEKMSEKSQVILPRRWACIRSYMIKF